MNKVLPPLHAQMQFPDLNLPNSNTEPVSVSTPKITMSPMRIYVLVCMYQQLDIAVWAYNHKPIEAQHELIDMGLATYTGLTLKGMEYLKKLQEVHP
jgi:hypothetical protein